MYKVLWSTSSPISRIYDICEGRGHFYRLCSHNCYRCQSMVNSQSCLKGCCQSMLRNTVNDDNGRSQCRMDEVIHKNHNLHLSLRAFRSTRIEQQALQEVPRTIDSQNCRTVKVQLPKDRWSTVKPLRRARQNFNPQSQLSMEVTPLISALSCNEKSLDTITKLLYVCSISVHLLVHHL